jgi:hypothetical protein
MTSVSAWEFSCNALSRYSPLVAEGLVRLSSTTTSDLDQLSQYKVPDDVSPLDVLLAEREEDDR